VEFIASKGQDFALNSEENIVLMNINSAHKQDFTYVLFVGMAAADFDISGEN
jgi:hypothetical protein